MQIRVATVSSLVSQLKQQMKLLLLYGLAEVNLLKFVINILIIDYLIIEMLNFKQTY